MLNFLQSLFRGKKRDDLEPVEPGETTSVIIQYPVCGSFGTDADLQRRHRIEQLLDADLRSAGAGYCDGGDIGSGNMNLFCLVQNSEAAVAHILACLKKHDLLEGALIAVEQGDELPIVWPVTTGGNLSLF